MYIKFIRKFQIISYLLNFNTVEIVT
jgi:hypothetical protein